MNRIKRSIKSSVFSSIYYSHSPKAALGGGTPGGLWGAPLIVVFLDVLFQNFKET
jgi:hypothetical protein